MSVLCNSRDCQNMRFASTALITIKRDEIYEIEGFGPICFSHQKVIQKLLSSK